MELCLMKRHSSFFIPGGVFQCLSFLCFFTAIIVCKNDPDVFRKLSKRFFHFISMIFYHRFCRLFFLFYFSRLLVLIMKKTFFILGYA